MILAAHQPQFAPWLGFFDKLDRADIFVLLDNVQFKKNEWQNRNRIKTSTGPQWLTVPVSFHFGDRIDEVAISQRQNWRHRHRQSLRTCYSRAPYYQSVSDLYEKIAFRPWDKLCDFNIALLRALMHELGIVTPIVIASELEPLDDDRDLRLIQLCRRLGAQTYLAGEGGRSYMNLDRFRSEGIDTIFQHYQHPCYSQLFGEFHPRLSILDLLFNCGATSKEVVRGGRVKDREGS